MRRSVLKFILLVFIYLVFAIPFRSMNLIPGFTDVRPVTTVGAIYAIFIGPLGCMASACGNLIADIIDNALHWSCFAGFAANFLGPCLIWYLWRKYGKLPFALRTMRELLFHSAVIIISALLETAIISPAVSTAYPEVNILFFSLTVFWLKRWTLSVTAPFSRTRSVETASFLRFQFLSDGANQAIPRYWPPNHR